MSIRPPGTSALIRELIERGDYEGPETVGDEAPAALMKRNQFTALKAAIVVGDDRAALGQAVLSTSDFLSRLKREAMKNLRLGRPCKDEVTA